MLSFLPTAVIVVGLLSTSPSARTEDLPVTEALPIHYWMHWMPQEFVPLLAPMVQAHGSLAAAENRLIVTNTYHNLGRINDVVRAIDQPPRNLRISVRYEESHSMAGPAADTWVQIGSPKRRLLAGDQPVDEPAREAEGVQGNASDPQVKVRRWRTRSAFDGHREQHLRVIDGARACISRGKLAPIDRQDVFFIHGAPIGVEAITGFFDLSMGFCVVPRLRGGEVLLDIAPQSKRASLGDSRTFETRTMHTTLSLPLGQWVEIGGMSPHQVEGVQGRRWSTHASETVFIKVDELSP